MKPAGYIILMIILLTSFSVFNASASEEADLLNSIKNNDALLSVEIRTEQSEDIFFEGDEVSFLLVSSEDCYVIALWLTADGNCTVLLPNRSHPEFHISGGSKYEIPGFKMDKIKLEGPEGIHRIKAIATIDEHIFDSFPGLPEGQDFFVIKSENVSSELKEIKKWLNNTSADKWATYDLKFTVMENLETTPVAVGTPNINPELLSLTGTDPNGAGIDVEAMTAQGYNYYSEKKYDKAIEAFEKVIKADSNHLYGYYCLGLSYQAKGAFDEAIRSYKECLNHKYMEKECYMRVAEIYDQTGEKDKAYVRYKLALKVIPGYENAGSASPEESTNRRIYDLERECEKTPSLKEKRMELIAIYTELENYSAACYHLKVLLEQAVPLYKGCSMEEDRPVVEEPVEIQEAEYVSYTEPYYGADYYTYYEPYYEPYVPPPPPPIDDAPTW